MEKIVRFEVPSEVLGDFVQDIADRKKTATVSATKHEEEYYVSVPYEKDEEDEINELSEYLDNLISDAESEEEEEEEDEDR